MSPRSRRSGGLRPPSSGPARPEHRPAATSRRSLQACIASLPLQSSLMSDTYLKSDHFNGGGSGGAKLPLPFTTRMTVVRLSNGDLFLHSPIKLDGRLAKELLGLGAVRHLVSPNQFHYAHIGEWAKAFPSTVSWASPRVRGRARARHVDVDFTRDLEASPPEEWRREIDQTLFPGGYFKEFIFFHKASKTLILADTIVNIELDKVTEPWRTATKFTGMYHPHGQIFLGMRLPLFLQRQKAEAAIRKIYSWLPQRILLSHGRCFDADADKVIRRIFGEPPP